MTVKGYRLLLVKWTSPPFLLPSVSWSLLKSRLTIVSKVDKKSHDQRYGKETQWIWCPRIELFVTLSSWCLQVGSHICKDKQFGWVFHLYHLLDNCEAESLCTFRMFALPEFIKEYISIYAFRVWKRWLILFAPCEPYFRDFGVIFEGNQICEVVDAVLVCDKADFNCFSCVGSWKIDQSVSLCNLDLFEVSSAAKSKYQRY